MVSKDVQSACDYLDDIVKDSKEKGVEVGFFGGAKYPNGLEIAENAIIQNYGSPKNGIPPRPFFDTCIKENEDKWSEKFAELIAKGVNVKQALNVIGELIKTDLQDSIANGNWVANAPSTIKKKKSSRPLIDTGTMINSIHKHLIT